MSTESSTSTIELGRQGMSPVETCRRMGWGVGTVLVGDEGYGPTIIRITAIGERSILAVCVSHAAGPCHGVENLWTLDSRDWSEVNR